jgi:hypothetical protein
VEVEDGDGLVKLPVEGVGGTITRDGTAIKKFFPQMVGGNGKKKEGKGLVISTEG